MLLRMDYMAFHAGSTKPDLQVKRGDGEVTPTNTPTRVDKSPARGDRFAASRPSSSGLGLRPFTAATAVRICSGVSEKTCSICRESKHFDEFNRDRTKRDGRQSLCRACQKGNYLRGDNRERSLERTKQYALRNPEARRAHHKLEQALIKGRVRREGCSECGDWPAEAHHHKGYDKPLDVQWLCRSCHVNIEPRRGVG